MIEKIQMVDLHSQYLRLKPEIDAAMQSVWDATAFINGPQVKEFASRLAAYLSIAHVLPCGNGTDALQIALMGLELEPGDEVIVPAFTYVAAVEVIALLGYTPVLVDVDPHTFNIDAHQLEEALSSRTRAIVVVHLFGQCADMNPVLEIASRHDLYVIEDNAQSVGATYTFPDGSIRQAGTMGHIGTTSFFPSKPLACYGDGGAMMTADEELADRLHKIANHGQGKKYHHERIGCNSRLDTLQAAILNVKLTYMDAFTKARRQVAARYDEAFQANEFIVTPHKAIYSTHVYHQYTLQVKEGKRDDLQAYLLEKGIPSMVYYPFPVHEQEAFRELVRTPLPLQEAVRLSRSVLSLPIHTEMTTAEQEYIIETINSYA
ncbi:MULTISPECIES: DegT/DnrJ/EryC1/StrS family aminotransferase [unclassified Parabacteroides]|uniref:DegT/DnrJ/EryC1/StrS family aminotransferase n=1 Tax=unclassified Parabacteroides TaxID=2649774 RepID=UPI0019442179|nr:MULTISPECIES: DegT/DnrJ/EryC1/StrS family aminotransferase [unclassified Parabacteroides]